MHAHMSNILNTYLLGMETSRDSLSKSFIEAISSVFLTVSFLLFTFEISFIRLAIKVPRKKVRTYIFFLVSTLKSVDARRIS